MSSKVPLLFFAVVRRLAELGALRGSLVGASTRWSQIPCHHGAFAPCFKRCRKAWNDATLGNVSRGGKTHVAFAQSLKFANASGRRRILFSDLSYFCHPDMPFIWDPQNSKWGKAKVITSYHKGYVGVKVDSWFHSFTYRGPRTNSAVEWEVWFAALEVLRRLLRCSDLHLNHLGGSSLFVDLLPQRSGPKVWNKKNMLETRDPQDCCLQASHRTCGVQFWRDCTMWRPLQKVAKQRAVNFGSRTALQLGLICQSDALLAFYMKKERRQEGKKGKQDSNEPTNRSSTHQSIHPSVHPSSLHLCVPSPLHPLIQGSINWFMHLETWYMMYSCWCRFDWVAQQHACETNCTVDCYFMASFANWWFRGRMKQKSLWERKLSQLFHWLKGALWTDSDSTLPLKCELWHLQVSPISTATACPGAGLSAE